VTTASRAELVAAARGPAPRPMNVPSAVRLAPGAGTGLTQAPRTPEAMTIDELLAAAEGHELQKIRLAGVRIRASIGQLRNDLAADTARSQAQAEVKRLRAELAAAEAKLRGAVQPTSTAANPEYPAARAWARDNGIDCPAKGRVPRAVMDAWKAATT